MISLGLNINDMVAFMTSPVATFIDKITEQDIFNNFDISVNAAIEMAKGKFMDNKGRIQKKYINDYGLLTMQMIQNLYYKLNLGKKPDVEMTEELKQKYDNVQKDIAEFENILEGANEFSNFGRFLGMNQGIKTSKIDMQKFENFVKQIFTDRLSKVTLNKEQKQLISKVGNFDVERWFSDSEYRKDVANAYDCIKKCINIFHAFTTIPQFDAIRELYSAVKVVDENIPIKGKAFNAVINKLIDKNPYIPESYQANILNAINNEIINEYLTERMYQIPVKKGWHRINKDKSKGVFAEDGVLTLKDRADFATFKYLMENTIIPNLKQGKVVTFDGVEQDIPSLKSNKFIQDLKLISEKNYSFYKVQMSLQNKNKSALTFFQYNNLVQGLKKLTSVHITPNMTLTDMFMLYNLIVHKNQYGANRLTALFESFVNSKTLINDYLKWLGKMDYSGEVSLTETIPNGLSLSYKDILISAAPVVTSKVGQNAEYIILMNKDGIPSLLQNTGGKGQYSEVSPVIQKYVGESEESFIERLQNSDEYFTLGGEYSDTVQRQIKALENLDNNTISYLNEWIKQGLLTIKKICE